MKIYLVLRYGLDDTSRVVAAYTKKESADKRAGAENGRINKLHSYHVIKKTLKGKIS